MYNKSTAPQVSAPEIECKLSQVAEAPEARRVTAHNLHAGTREIKTAQLVTTADVIGWWEQVSGRRFFSLGDNEYGIVFCWASDTADAINAGLGAQERRNA